MMIVIPSKGRPQSIRTHKLFKKHQYKIVLHNEIEAAEYLKNPSIDPASIVVSGAPFGVTNQRNWIVENLIPKGEWYITLDDNINSFKGVNPEHYGAAELPVTSKTFDKKIFDYQLSELELMDRFSLDVLRAEESGATYLGFATVPNYYFLGRKYRDVGYVISKAAIIKNLGRKYDANIKAMDDYGFTADCLARDGLVQINNFIIPEAGHYEAGGIGPYEQRLPAKIADAAYLRNKYPGLFRYKVKAGTHPKAELQVAFTSRKQVEEWRRSNFPFLASRVSCS